MPLPHLSLDWLTALVILGVILILLIPLAGHHYANALKVVSDGAGQGFERAAKACATWAASIWTFCIDHVTPYSEKQKPASTETPSGNADGPTGQYPVVTPAYYQGLATVPVRRVNYPGSQNGNGYSSGYNGNGYSNGNGHYSIAPAPYQPNYNDYPPPATPSYPDPLAEVPITGQRPAVSAEPKDEEKKPRSGFHVVELIFAELLFLFLTLTVVLSDFVFTAERINTVLFHAASGINLGPLNFLRDLGAGLAGVLIAGIALLSAGIAFDVSGLIPEGAQLFPHITKVQRRVLLSVSAALMVLAVIVSAFLGYLGQQILDQSHVIFPMYETITIVSLLVALFIAIALMPWAIMRGAAAVGVVIALPVILLLSIMGWLLGFVGHVIRVIGDLFGNVLLEIYNVFHQNKVRTTRRVTGRLVVVGMGRTASAFATEVCKDIAPLARPGYLNAAGIYTGDQHTYEKSRQALQVARIGGAPSHQAVDISVKPEDQRPVARLLSHISEAFLANGAAAGNATSQGLLLWVIDLGEKSPEGELMDLAVRQMDAWRKTGTPGMRGVRVSVVALVPRTLTAEHTAALSRLEALTRAGSPAGVLTVEPSFLVLRDNTEASGQLGAAVKRLFARGLASSISATSQEDNQSLGDVLDELRNQGYTFAAISSSSAGVVGSHPGKGVKGWYERNSGYQPKPFLDDVTARTQQVAAKVLSGAGTTSVLSQPDDESRPVAVVCLAPLPAESAEASRFKDVMRGWFANPPQKLPAMHNVSILVGNEAEGVDISSQDVTEAGDRYCQVSAIYGLDTLAYALPNIQSEKAPMRQTVPMPAIQQQL